jgi:hypothetical protein
MFSNPEDLFTTSSLRSYDHLAQLKLNELCYLMTEAEWQSPKARLASADLEDIGDFFHCGVLPRFGLS